MMKRLPTSLLLSTLFLVGCATYSKRQCEEMDWYREGRTAALNGLTRKEGKTPFIDKCQEDQGVAVDVVAFDRGFANGLNKLCTPEGREALAAKGIKYQETCESHDDAVNLEQNRKSELQERVNELEEEVARLKKNCAPAPTAEEPAE